MNFKHILLYFFSLLVFFGMGMCNKAEKDETTTEVLFTAVPSPADIDELKDLFAKRLKRAEVDFSNLEIVAVDEKFYRLTFEGRQPKANLQQLLETTGKITVYSTWNNSEIFSYLNKINAMLGELLYKRDSLSSGGKMHMDTNKQGMADSTMLYGKRVKRSNGIFDIVQPATTTQNGKINLKSGPVIGYIMPVDTQILNKVMQMEEVRDSIPAGLKPAIGNKSLSKDKLAYELIALRNSGASMGIIINAGDVEDVEIRKPENKQDVTELILNLKKSKSDQIKKLHRQYPESYLAISADETVVHYWDPSVNNNFSTLSIIIDDKSKSAKTVAAILENPSPYQIQVTSIDKSQELKQK